ncbi:MAG: hypothetical protein MUF21_14005 [Gemmatimonadaceae bacterium]|nr:hypothetical protein [Gemmatimonadaceae bacterium]
MSILLDRPLSGLPTRAAALDAALAPRERLRSVHGSRRHERTTLVGVTDSRLIITHVERQRDGDHADGHRCWTRVLPLAAEAT